MNLEEMKLRGTHIRVHGNGFLQLDVGENERIHVFGHPRLPRQKVATPIHNHRFGFKSKVLRGVLVNLDWAFVPDNTWRASHQGYNVVPRQEEDTELVPVGSVGAIMLIKSRTLVAGKSYEVKPRQFHQSMADEPTVTHMVKTENVPGYEPMVLCRKSTIPDNSFNRYDLDEPTLWRILEESLA